MSIDEKLVLLGVPEIEDPKATLNVAASGLAAKKVKLTGVVLGKTSDAVFLKTHAGFYQIKIDAITNLDKDKSPPSRNQLDVGVAVVVSIPSDAEILELRVVRAGSAAPSPGKHAMLRIPL